VLKQILLGELLCGTPLLTQTHRAPFNRGIQGAGLKGNVFGFRISLSLLRDVVLACHSDIGFPEMCSLFIIFLPVVNQNVGG